VRVYKSAKNWQYIHEISCIIDDKGTLHISTIEEQLQTSMTVLPIDPKRYHPYYQYNSGKLTVNELEDLMDPEGFLQV
ncbi:hypothetical protein BDQ17DRAFT_1223071, partial [Cyathus striatus]